MVRVQLYWRPLDGLVGVTAAGRRASAAEAQPVLSLRSGMDTSLPSCHPCIKKL